MTEVDESRKRKGVSATEGKRRGSTSILIVSS